MSSNESLAMLRDLLFIEEGEPTRDHWEAVCDLLEVWSNPDDLDIGLDYAARHMDAWPDSLREGPMELWTPLLNQQNPPPLWSLVRHLNAADLKLSSDALTLLLQHQAISQIRCLDLSSNKFNSLWGVFTQTPHLADLHTLNLSGNQLGSGGGKSLAQATNIKQLRCLKLEHNKIGIQGIQSLLKAPYLQKLKELSLARNKLGLKGATALAQSTFLNLEHLDLHECHLDVQAMEALTENSFLSGIQTLNLSDNWIGDEGLSALARCPSLSSLEILHLSRTGISSKGLRELLHSPHLRALKVLHLSGNQFRAPGAKVIAQSPCLPQLEELHLDSCLLGSEGLQHLISSSPSIKVLNLAGNSLRAGDIERLASWEALAHITSLDLAENRIEQQGALALASSPHLKTLRNLNLETCYIGHQGVASLAAQGALSCMVSLNLVDNDFGSKGLLSLIRSGKLEAMEHLLLSGERFSDQAIQELAQATLPKLATLHMTHCRMNISHARMLAQAPWMHHLREFHLTHNDMNDLGAMAFHPACQQRPWKRLTLLDLRYNRLTEAGGESLSQAIGLSARIRRTWKAWRPDQESWHYNRYDGVWE